MKITRRRSAISQSMDLFIIIAAVLGVGGVVTASVYNLVNSATANTSISLVGVSLKAGGATGNPPAAMSVSIKNNGGTPITCTSTTCQVAFAGTNAGSTTPTCSSATCTLVSGGMTWGLGPSGAPLTLTASGTLSPGEETSVVVNGPITQTGGAYWASGSQVTVNVLFGSASAQVTVISQ